MIVVPKELYNLPDDDEFYKNLSTNNVMRNFNVKKQRETFQESPHYHFTSLRKSISHVNYSIEDDGSFIMWDHPPRKTAEKFWHWHIEITRSDMNLFLGQVNEEIFRIYNKLNK